MNFLDQIRDKRIKKIQEIGLKVGQWVNLQGEYPDVWHEVAVVYDPACSVFIQKSTKDVEVKTDYISFAKIDKIVDVLPIDARCVYCKKGAFSERRNNIHEFHKEYFAQSM